MLRPAALSLLLACAASLGSSATITENGMPIRWAQASSQITDLPKQNGVVAPEPWHFLNRMSLYRVMIAATDPFMGSMGKNATDSPFWSLPLQLGWMFTSGRLADPTGATTCGLQTGDTVCISPQSWWGCVNYFLSVLPFLSAAQQGFMGPGVQVKMQQPAGVQDFCTTHDDCAARHPDVMAKWDAFFQSLKALNESQQPDKEKKDSLLGLFWAAQMASLAAPTAFKSRQSHYPSEEVSFANSWLNTAGYVSAAHFHSNLDNSVLFISPLPSRVLNRDNSDLSKDELHTLSTFSWLKTLDFFLGGRLMRLWKSAMCSMETREKGRELLKRLLLDPSFPMTTISSLIGEIRKSC